MIKYVASLFIVFVLCQASLFAQSMQYENQIIEKIDVVVEQLPSGADFDTAAVLARIKTHAGDMFAHITFDSDLKALAQEFDRVIPKLESINGKLYITLRIWPKPMIRTITWGAMSGSKRNIYRKSWAFLPERSLTGSPSTRRSIS